ncbi:hypothetical protein H8Z72_23265 (plasmid) [Xanthomonas citri pv. citri]|uniref:hypothetical protein n=1 Tax=Xanthomonas citri TaxID=346 RepID=UPI0019311D05|nr:hypothetical protein [Xanthomonas citri]QRD62766.1 hypothetical protein H8Z74_22920 [Xanthomonas citri pv. citri]QRD67093.1 hypothetical protein H8Z73_23005 [Xanthomonas citri pv. citri]QRD71654.1 hypothetical protein H8Z72_23265 [Xanthomonas citri pv. citri]
MASEASSYRCLKGFALSAGECGCALPAGDEDSEAMISLTGNPDWHVVEDPARLANGIRALKIHLSVEVHKCDPPRATSEQAWRCYG